MESSEETNGSVFPAVDPKKELNPGKNEGFQVDSRSSEIATFVKDKEQANEEEGKNNASANEAKKKNKEDQGKKDEMQTLKSTIIISAIVVALAGAVFAITKKLKEK